MNANEDARQQPCQEDAPKPAGMSRYHQYLQARHQALAEWRRQFRQYSISTVVVLTLGGIAIALLPMTLLTAAIALALLLFLVGVLAAGATYSLGHVHAYAPPGTRTISVRQGNGHTASKQAQQ